jgi:WD40 repeat protein
MSVDLRLVSDSLEASGSPYVGAVAVHRKLVHAVVVLPDGDTCVTASEDGGRLGIVSLSTMEVRGWLSGHEGPVNHLAVDPATGLVVSAGDDHTVRVWSVKDGRAVHIMSGHEHFVRQVGVAAGRIVSASQDGTVRVWDLATGAGRQVLRNHTADVMAVAISADGRTAASSSMDNTVLVWNLDEGGLAFPLYDTQSQLMKFSELGGMYLSIPGPGADPGLHRECPTWLWLSPDGRQLASAHREVIWWELATGAELARIPNQGSYIQSAAPHPTSDQLAVAGLAGVQLWRVPAGHRTADEPRLEAGLTGDHTWSVAYTPDGATLVAGTDSGELHVWRSTVDPVWADRPVHLATISHVAIAPDGRGAATVDSGGTVQRWNLDSGARLDRARHADTDAFGETLAYGGILVSAGSNELLVWDGPETAPPRRLDAPDDDLSISPLAVAVLPGDRSVLLGALGDGLYRWSLVDGGRHALAGGTTRVGEIRVSRDGAWALTLGFVVLPVTDGQERRALQCWNLETDRLEWTQLADGSWPSGDGPGINFVVPALDGRTAISGSTHYRNGLARWDLATGALLADVELPEYIVDTQWQPDGTLLVALSGTSVRWVSADFEVTHRSVAIDPDFHSLALVPGGRFAVARQSSAERDVVLLDLNDGTVAARFNGDAAIHDLVVAPDGDSVVATDARRRVHILHVVPA